MRTSRQEFAQTGSNNRVVPFTRRVLADDETALGAYRKLTAGRPAGSFLIERPGDRRPWSRWSYIGVRSPAALTGTLGETTWEGDRPGFLPAEGAPVSVLRQTLRLLRTDAPPTMPLAGGMVGYVSHGHGFACLPEMFLLLATDVAVHDRFLGCITLVANALVDDGRDPDAARADAMARLDDMSARLATTVPSTVRAMSVPVPRSAHRRTTTADALDIYRALRTMAPGRHMHLLRSADFDVVGGGLGPGGIGKGRHGGVVGYLGFNGDISTGAANCVLVRNGETHVAAGPEAEMLHTAIAAAETLDTPASVTTCARQPASL